jgi:hypothetical protein
LGESGVYGTDDNQVKKVKSGEEVSKKNRLNIIRRGLAEQLRGKM